MGDANCAKCREFAKYFWFAQIREIRVQSGALSVSIRVHRWLKVRSQLHRSGLAKLFVEHHGGDDEADGGNDLADASLRDALRVVRAEEIPGQRAHGHHERFRPINQSREDEIDWRDLMDERAEDGLDAIHLMNVGESQIAE